MRQNGGVIAWMAHNPVAANLLMAMVFLLGLYAAVTIKKEIFPTFPAEVMTVVVPYPGGTPEEIEQSIIIKIEEIIQDLDGIKEISSKAQEGSGIVTITIQPGLDLAEMLNKVTVRVNSIASFPAETEEPIISEQLSRVLVMKLALYGGMSETQLTYLADEVRDDLLALSGITQVDIMGTREFEISIEVSDATLRQYGLTFDKIVTAIRARSLDLPGGSLRTSAGTVTLRSKGQAYNAFDFSNLVLITEADGTLIKLGDIATIHDGFEEQPLLSRFNNRPSVFLDIYSIGQQDALKISKAVHRYAALKQQELLAGVSITPWYDRSRVLKSRIRLLLKNALQGGLLVLLTLALFLRPKLAFWVIAGIPFCFLGTLFMMQTPLIDISINVISLFGFILVLGIVVDDAIVTAESAYSTLEEEQQGIDSIIHGVRRVTIATIFGVITTILAFTPLLLLESGLARFFSVMAIVVIFSLIFSLLETKLILPAHLRHMQATHNASSKRHIFALISQKLMAFQSLFNRGMKTFVVRYYKPSLVYIVKYRYVTLAIFISALILSIALIPAGIVRFVFFPNVPSDNIRITLLMPESTPYKLTHDYAKRIEQAAVAVNKSYRDQTGVDYDLIENIGTLSDKDTEASLLATLIPATKRDIDSVAIADMWRQQLGPLAGIKELSFQANIVPGGSPINIKLESDQLSELRAATIYLRNALQEFSSVFDIRDTFGTGSDEIIITTTAVAETLGLGQAELARQVRQAFFGAEVQRVQRGRHEVRVYVRFPKADRTSINNLTSMWVRLPDGSEIPFSVVGNIKSNPGISVINRLNRQRVVNVKANVDKATIEPDAVIRALEQKYLSQEFNKKFPNVNFSFAGEAQEQAENTQAMILGGFIICIMIYAALAIPLKSYTQPFYIMSVIPFGVVGAILGHLLIGKAISILSIMGIIALAGIVVNDSLVLVDHINQTKQRYGTPQLKAVLMAGERRFRAVILTSVTTFSGLLPLLLETSIQAQFLIPMAISVSFGVMFATTVTLFLVPLLFFIVDDLISFFKKIIIDNDIKSNE